MSAHAPPDRSRWLTILTSLALNLYLAAVLCARLETAPPYHPPLLGGLAAGIMAGVAGWRWPRFGGLASLACAGELIFAAVMSGEGLLVGLALAAPLALVGCVFLADSRDQAAQAGGL